MSGTGEYDRMLQLDSVKIFLRSESNRNVLALMTGTGLAQLIPIIISPVLSRIYSPEQFGVFALFVATVSSLSVIATGRYELAIMLPRKEVNAVNITALSIILAVNLSIVLFGVAWLFNTPISHALGSDAISTWLYLVPLAVLFNGVYSSLNYWSNRNKLYWLMARRRVLHSGGTSMAQLGLGLLGAKAGGLIVGSILGQALASWMMAKVTTRYNRDFWRSIRKGRMWALAKRYKSCPQLLVPAHTLSALSVQLPVIFINSLFGSSASGFFMLAERVVGMPLSLVSASIGDVFRQEISECFLAGENCRANFLSTLRKLTAIATPPFILLTIFGPSLFAFVFGEGWRTSGEYVQYMCPMFYLRFISNPLSLVAIVAQKNKFELLWQICLLIFLILIVVSHYYIQLSTKNYIIVFASISVALDLVNLVACYRFACAGDSIQTASRVR